MAKKEAHHGGAWKVAYADFVTAMMALFMVLWISSQDKKILIATSRYFQHPFAYESQGSTSIVALKQQNKVETGTGTGSGGDESASRGMPGAQSSRQIELNFLNSVATDFKKLLRIDEDIQQRPIDVQVTSDGLRLILFDRARKPLFVGDSTQFTEWGRFVIQNMAWLIDRHRFRVVIDGHTRAGIKPRADGYSAWELSSDQANAARRLLVLTAVDPAAIDRVSGYADTQPIPGAKPEAESNSRLTISLSLAHRRSGGGDQPDSPAPPASPQPPSDTLQ